jgi:hypothetical protein
MTIALVDREGTRVSPSANAVFHWSARATSSRIGARLSISPKTVDTYKQRIQAKLELTHDRSTFNSRSAWVY